MLLVEDDATCASCSREVLERDGYRVLQAADGGEALALAGQDPRPIDLLVTDVVMPGHRGRDWRADSMRIRPGLRVLFISGYTDDAMLRLGVSNRNEAFLQKPFGPRTFVQKVRRSCGAEGRGVVDA